MKEKRKNKVVSKHRQDRTHSLGLMLLSLVKSGYAHPGSDMNEEWCVCVCVLVLHA